MQRGHQPSLPTQMHGRREQDVYSFCRIHESCRGSAATTSWFSPQRSSNSGELVYTWKIQAQLLSRKAKRPTEYVLAGTASCFLCIALLSLPCWKASNRAIISRVTDHTYSRGSQLFVARVQISWYSPGPDPRENNDDNK